MFYLSGLLPFENSEQVFFNNLEITNSSLNQNVYLTKEKEDLIPGTLLDNLTFFEPTKEEFTKKLVDLLNLSDLNLNEQVNVDNYQYSHGQLQRIALIRALNSDKNILIFDESISNIDQANVVQILEFLQNLDKTIILISHTMKPKYQKYFNRKIEVAKGEVHELL
ncbi:ABC transporter ATP-binding protein (plasmid) [Mycoplasmopsis gallopavonis]|uniref:ABC transporter ATP-binding protein n=2 Tax=Mycoplasmopsis gallopavonis TaxID=76629 RepID=A0A449B0B8_9BACT|nr:ABC transporter ATP-binding protein [Mycoplasmopsis gallopavonis]